MSRPASSARPTHQSPPGASTRASGGSPTFDPIAFTLSWPVSINLQYRIAHAGDRIVRSSRAKRAFERGATELMLQRVPRRALSCSLVLEIRAFPKDRRVRDLDNLLKPTLDLLTRHGVIADDRFVDELRIVREVPDGEARLVCSLLPRR